MKLPALLLLLPLVAAHALDFTPLEVKERTEGGMSTYLEFRDGRNRLTYTPPRGWEYRGDAVSFRLAPPDFAGVEIDFRTQALGAPLTASEENLAAFEAFAREALPSGATKVENVVAAFNPIEIDGRKTVEVMLSYSYFGQNLKASCLYVVRECAPVRFRVDSRASSAAAREASLLIFRVAAKPGDFARVRATLHGSLHTLAGL
jgi:hypothetical protein